MAKKTQKTHKGLAKVVKVRNSGSTKIHPAGTNHKSGKKNANFNRKNRTAFGLSSGDQKRIKDLI